MIVLILFAFLGGIVTILSPCILPILPIVLSGTITGGKRRPLGVVTGFVASFTFFTLFLSAIVKATGLSADALRIVAVVIISLFGLSLVIPALQKKMEELFSRVAQMGPRGNTNDGFVSGMLVGLSLGLVWTPCVGPILASIITLAATSSVTLGSVIITLAYALGTAIPLLAITYGGRTLLTKTPWLLQNTARIQRGFGVLMLVTALAIFFSWDRQFQAYILTKFPSYGTGLTQLEDNAVVQKELRQLKNKPEGGSMLDSLLEPSYGNAPELIAGGQWFNSEPLTLAQLKGKVVLIDFWTYTCINCIRTLPYVKSWWEKYKDKGLVIIGVHTPEFEFEKNADNVQKAIEDFGITYPVMQDNDYATWRAYDNHYWPAEYFIDKNGVIRRTHFGEGKYDESEKFIQKLLEETGVTDQPEINNQEYQIHARTPETYLGYARMQGIAGGQSVQPDTRASYEAPDSLPLNRFALNGTWTVGEERAMPEKTATLTYRFSAKNVYLVMRPLNNEGTANVRVYLDGKLAGAGTAGEDVTDGLVSVTTDRLYTLIHLSDPGEHTQRLEFTDGNIDLYAVTFGGRKPDK